MNEEIIKAADLIRNSSYLIALTGAGISRESNVPTFRGKDGLWRNYDPMELATPQAFKNNPKLVWEWYAWRQGLIASCEPNPGHTSLVELEKKGILKTLITQNVDGLHPRAGSQNVLPVHGDLWEVKCTSCSYGGRLSEPATEIPICPECRSNLRPDVVWFGENLDINIMHQVREELNSADGILVIGTSSVVQPAASFPIAVSNRGGWIIEINIEETPLTPLVTIHLNGPSGELLPSIVERL